MPSSHETRPNNVLVIAVIYMYILYIYVERGADGHEKRRRRRVSIYYPQQTNIEHVIYIVHLRSCTTAAPILCAHKRILYYILTFRRGMCVHKPR